MVIQATVSGFPCRLSSYVRAHFGRLGAAVVATAALSLSACEGDTRPLTEAVEGNAADLASIEIQPPSGSLSPLFVSPGDSVQMRILGRTLAGASITLPATDRRWVSTDESVASVSNDGLVLGRANGSVSIGVRVAGAVAPFFDVFVSDAALQSLDRIESTLRGNTLDSCLPVNFSAIGNFGGNDFRVLNDVLWSIDADSQLAGAEIFTGANTPSGSISLVGRRATTAAVGEIVLTAVLPADDDAGRGELSVSRQLEVSDTLTELTVTPAASTIEVGALTRLVARASYSDRAGEVLVTNGAEWMVTRSPGVVSVGNVMDSPGVVRGTAMGVAEVSASCGALSAAADVTVEDNSGSLSFNSNGSLLLNLLDREYDELRVSTGDEYSASRDVSGEAEWLSSDTGVITVDNVGDDRGTLTLLTEGISTISAEFEGTLISIDVTVDTLGIGN